MSPKGYVKVIFGYIFNATPFYLLIRAMLIYENTFVLRKKSLSINGIVFDYQTII